MTLLAAAVVGAAVFAAHGVRQNAYLTHLANMAYGPSTLPTGSTSQQTVAVNSGTITTQGVGQTSTVGTTSTVVGNTTITTTITATTTSTGITLTAIVDKTTGGTTTTVAAPTITLPTATATTIFKDKGATQVVIDPTPTQTTVGDQKVIGVTLAFENSTGGSVSVTNLAAPIAVTIPGPFPPGYVPAFSTDGKTFAAVPEITGGGNTLPTDWQTGYYVSGSDYVILTRHATLFGAVSQTGLSVSASGRKFAPAGSRRWGDPELVKPGPPILRFVKAPTRSGDAVSFSYFVNEQVAAYLQVYSGGKEANIYAGKSIYREHRLSGPIRRTIHIVMTHPGTADTTLRVPRLAAGAKVQVTVIDFDGNRVSKTLKVH